MCESPLFVEVKDDLLMGRNGKSAIGTLVERFTPFLMLFLKPPCHGKQYNKLH